MESHSELKLEDLFSQAVDEPAYRPLFLEALLAGHVYCVGYSQDPQLKKDVSDLQQHKIEAGTQIFIKSWDDTEFDRIIPFFTSLEKMQQAIDSKESFMCLPTKIFMQMTTGAKLVLNPESDAVKVFYPVEVQALLDGNYSLNPDEYIYDEEIEVLMSEPSPYPKDMLKQLKLYLAQCPEVKAAYVAEMLDNNRDVEPVLIIGLLFKKSLSHSAAQQLHQQLGQVAFDSLKGDERAIDLVHLDQEDIADGVEKYLLEETLPFYVAKDEDRLGLFAKLFS